MKLWYITIGLDRGSYDLAYCYEFTTHTRFISSFLSRGIRKTRFDTKGEFRLLSIQLGPGTKDPIIVGDDILEVYLPFDKDRYDAAKGSVDCTYYLESMTAGFRAASMFRDLPVDSLVGLVDTFKNSDCRHEWLHKKKRFSELDLSVALNCYFTTNDFTLIASIEKISTKETLCSGLLLRTEPDEICFNGKFKDILIDNGQIVVTDFLDRPRFVLDRVQAMKKRFAFTCVNDLPNR